VYVKIIASCNGGAFLRHSVVANTRTYLHTTTKLN